MTGYPWRELAVPRRPVRPLVAAFGADRGHGRGSRRPAWQPSRGTDHVSRLLGSQIFMKRTKVGRRHPLPPFTRDVPPVDFSCTQGRQMQWLSPRSWGWPRPEPDRAPTERGHRRLPVMPADLVRWDIAELQLRRGRPWPRKTPGGGSFGPVRSAPVPGGASASDFHAA